MVGAPIGKAALYHLFLTCPIDKPVKREDTLLPREAIQPN
jgi:hypothetical protein